MKNLFNIEKSGFHRGEYVGYAAGTVWRIKKTTCSDGRWVAYARDILPGDYHGRREAAFSLDRLSFQLEKVGKLFERKDK